MREIKFRAWSKNLNKMFKVGQVTLEKGGWNYEPDDKEYKGVCVPYQPSWVLMQFTGLYDKNKVPIYEGDIVIFEDCEMSTESGYGDTFINQGVVEYNDENCCFNVTERITVELVDVLYKDNESLEVIGNIYDNPDLLGE